MVRFSSSHWQGLRFSHISWGLLAQVIAAERDEAVQEALESARSAAEVHASLAAQRSSSGTGEMLRSNFVVVADLVEEQDGHLLIARERARTAEFKV